MRLWSFIFKDRSLEYKFALLSVVPIIIITTFMVIYIINSLERSMIEKTRIRVQGLTKLFALSMSNAFVIYNKDLLDNYVDRLAKEKNILYAMIVDSSDSRILAHSDHQNDGKIFMASDLGSSPSQLIVNKKQGKIYELSTPIIIGGKKYGDGWVGFSLEEVYQEIAVLKNKIIIVAIIAILLGALFSILLSRIISKPVRVLSEQAERIGAGNFEQKVIYKSKDALGQLAYSFNKMAENLKLNVSMLKDNEERFTKFMEYLPALAFMKDAEGRYVFTNSAYKTILGIEPADRIGKTDEVVWSAEIAATFMERDHQILATGQPLETVDTLTDSAGRRIIHLTSKFPIFREGKPALIGGIGLDITEIKKAESEIKALSLNLEKRVKARTSELEAAQEAMLNLVEDLNNSKDESEKKAKELNRALYDTEKARDRIDGILKSVGDGLIVTDIYNRIILMNRAAEDLLGARFSEVIDRPIDFAIKDKTLRNRVKTTLDKKKEGYEFDFELPGENTKHPHIMRARTSVIEDRNGKYTGIVTIMHDVTYKREVDRMKTEFLSTAAHELRTPLTSIQGFSEILLTRDDIKEEEKEECLSYINKQSVNLAVIINDLLDISRIESGKGFSLNKTPDDIAAIIRDAVPHFQILSPKHSFEVVVPKEPVEVMVDKEKMRQVLENFLSNAVKYSPDGGLIRVAGELLEENYQVSIEDQGIGMTSEQVEKIFDKFYRADASNTAIPGTGLGMSIAQYLVEAHGGKVWVESELGKGTIARFTIPIK